MTLHRWSFLPEIEKGDNVVLLVAENLTDLSPKLVSNPKVAVVEVPMPDRATRRAAAKQADPDLPDRDADRYADATAGLKSIQIASLITPAMSDAARAEADKLIAERKREILERECFGLVEFVEPEHGFEVVGGMDEVKKDLLVIAENIREGRTSRVPMGILFTGPMGTGKTFVAEAFAKECGLTTIKLKNFRSKWVGATEGNLEKILNVVKAIGQVVVIIDEGDRAFGSGRRGGGRRDLLARHRAHQGVHVRHVESRPHPLSRHDEPARQARRGPEARRPPRQEDPVPLLADRPRKSRTSPGRR